MRIKFNTRTAKIIDREIVTAGSVGMKVAVELSPDWAGLTKTAVFSGSGESIIVLESSWSGNEVEIPHECCTKAGTQLLMGIWGMNAAGTVVIPTVMVQLDFIKAGADPSGDESTDPTLPVWAQLQQDVYNVEDAIANEAIARAAADTELNAAKHTHSNKEVLDYITMIQMVKWNAKQEKLIAGSGITIAEDGKTISSTGGGGGSSAWADITGKPSTFPPSSHTHQQADIAGLVSNLSSKANAIHTHAQSDVTGLETALAGKAASTHTHSYNDLTNKPTIPAAVTDDHIASVAATVVPSDDITANTDARHTHDNKTVLDGITAAKVAAWDACVADYTAALGVI